MIGVPAANLDRRAQSTKDDPLANVTETADAWSDWDRVMDSFGLRDYPWCLRSSVFTVQSLTPMSETQVVYLRQRKLHE